MITWITRNVAIGEYLDSINIELLKNEGIDCILDLRVEVEEDIIRETLNLCSRDDIYLHIYHIAVGRGQGLEPIKIELRTAAYMLELLTEKYKRILVHCTAGIDRAPFVVAYWIVTKSNEIYYPNNSMSKEDFKEYIADKPKYSMHLIKFEN